MADVDIGNTTVPAIRAGILAQIGTGPDSWLLSDAQAGRAAREFDSLAGLLADTGLSYSAAVPRRVAEGNILRIRAAGYAYTVAAADAAAHDLATAGGVRLLALPGPRGHDLRAFGAVGDGVTDDSIAVRKWVAKAISARAVAYAPAGTYYCAQSAPQNLPSSDDGSGTRTAYDGSTASAIAAETVNQQQVCIVADIGTTGFLAMQGDGPGQTRFVGDWVYPATLSSKIMFMIKFGSVVPKVVIDGIEFRNSFIPIAQLDGIMFESRFRDLAFHSCGIAMLTHKLERCTFQDIHMIACHAGLVNGGQWRNRSDQYSEDGGWADKNIYDGISGQSFQSATAMASVDAWFADYIYKPGNNTTRKFPPGGTGTPATIAPYQGICSHSVTHVSRYHRPNTSNTFTNIRHMGARRAAVRLDSAVAFHGINFYAEGVGYNSGVNSGGAFGDLNEDPYRPGRTHNPIFEGNGRQGSVFTITGIDSQIVACNYALPVGVGVSYRSARRSVDNSLNVAPLEYFIAAGEDRTTSDIFGERARRANWTQNGFYERDLFVMNNIAAVSGISTATVQLPAQGTYILTARASPNGSVAHSRMSAALVTWFTEGSFVLANTTPLFANITSTGGIRPSDLMIGAPGTTGALTIQVNTAGQPDADLRISLVRLGGE